MLQHIIIILVECLGYISCFLMEKFNYNSSNASTAAPSGIANILEKNKLNILIIIINVLILVKYR